MTEDQAIKTTIVALAMAQSPMVRNGEEVGGMQINKSNGQPAYGAAAASVLELGNGTLTFTREDEDMYQTIYHKAAAMYFAPSAKTHEKVLTGIENAHVMRAGFTNLAVYLDKTHGMGMYRVNMAGSGSKVGAITVDPDYVVDHATGLTAREAQFTRDRKALKGQLGATYKRQARAIGPAAARELIQTEVNSLPAQISSN